MSKLKGIAILIGTFILLVSVSLGVYFAVYGTADTRGRVALHNLQRTPSELKFNYTYFHDTCHAILAETQQLKTLNMQLTTAQNAPVGNDPFGQHQSRIDQLSSDISGLSNVRDSDAQKYNAMSHEFTANFIKSKDLPSEIGPPNGIPYDSLTCEGNLP